MVSCFSRNVHYFDMPLLFCVRVCAFKLFIYLAFIFNLYIIDVRL